MAPAEIRAGDLVECIRQFSPQYPIAGARFTARWAGEATDAETGAMVAAIQIFAADAKAKIAWRADSFHKCGTRAAPHVWPMPGHRTLGEQWDADAAKTRAILTDIEISRHPVQQRTHQVTDRDCLTHREPQ